MNASDPRKGWLVEFQIANIRSFGQDTQRLGLVDSDGVPYQWTLILGNNGAGKSVFLLSLAVTLHAIYRNQQGDHVDFHGVDFKGPSNATGTDAHVAVKRKSAPSFQFACADLSGATPGTMLTPVVSDSLPDDYDWTESVALAYGPNRVSSEEIPLLSESPLGIGHLLSLTNGLRSPTKLLNANRNQLRDSRTNIDFAQILSQALPDGITVGFDDAQANSLTPFGEPVPVFATPTGPVPFAQLGYGYKTIVALVSDIASRLIEAYPSSPNALQESAICLIDELDLHLHPAWQRKLVKYLGETFVNTQFIATAHSPLMVQAAENANLALIHLSDEPDGSYRVSQIDNDVEHIRGWRLDQVVTSDLFGFESPYSPEVEAKVRMQDKLRTQDKLTAKEKADLEDLNKDLEKLPPGETFEQAKALLKLSEDSLRLLEKSREATP